MGTIRVPEVTLNAEFEPGTEHEGLEGRAALVSTLTDEDLLSSSSGLDLQYDGLLSGPFRNHRHTPACLHNPQFDSGSHIVCNILREGAWAWIRQVLWSSCRGRAQPSARRTYPPANPHVARAPAAQTFPSWWWRSPPQPRGRHHFERSSWNHWRGRKLRLHDFFIMSYAIQPSHSHVCFLLLWANNTGVSKAEAERSIRPRYWAMEVHRSAWGRAEIGGTLA